MKLVPDSAEPDALAMRLMARLVSDWSSHIDWEDVPELVEESWEQVGAEMDEIAVWMLKRADEFDREYHVDSRFLYEQATTPADSLSAGSAPVHSGTGPADAARPEVPSCGCCGFMAHPRNPDPWEGRLDGYCESCALARCDAYPGACDRAPAASHPSPSSPCIPNTTGDER